MNLLTSSVAFTPQNDQHERFVEKYSFEQRATQSAKIRAQYPDRVLVILEQAATKTKSEIITGPVKTKYLVPGDHTVGKFITTFRKQVHLAKEQGLYLFTLDNTLPASSMTMSQLDQKHRATDGFLYLQYKGENTFGTS